MLHAVDKATIWSHSKILHNIIQRNQLPDICKHAREEGGEKQLRAVTNKGKYDAQELYFVTGNRNFTHIYGIVEMLCSWIQIDYMNWPAHGLAMVVQTGAISWLHSINNRLEQGILASAYQPQP